MYHILSGGSSGLYGAHSLEVICRVTLEVTRCVKLTPRLVNPIEGLTDSFKEFTAKRTSTMNVDLPHLISA